ncbi:MAG TPA: glycosyl transferase [Lachnoclostridium phytofermentans]|uniref:Glycosyl transferase n=1 Tax=Lachnoclostridium phytofermentans TaxID=66219 RepID=A0A3D2X2Z4_9FIRM|nr:glycosyltransferase [Lachnoclostridium sp.]HCL01510.1 glycosyl transferase [Lachnoclostridium phytofermentans]
MKVLQINSVCGIGSTGRIATDIHNMLVEQGHESYIAYGRDVPKYCHNTIKIGNIYGTYKHVALTRIFDKHGFGSRKATQDFIKEIEEFAPDIIHLHNIHGYYMNIKLLFDYLKRVNKPIIWTLHDCWTFTGHCAYFDYVKCDKWKKQCFECPQKKSYPSSILMDDSKRNFLKKKEIFTGINNLTIVTPSDWLARLVKESFLKEYPVKVINNGIDLEAFKPTKSDFRKKHNIIDKFIILGVANIWDDRKGYRFFIDLLSYINQDEAIVLVGLTQEQKKRLPRNILGITRTNSVEELAEIYSMADVFVNPTLEDNFPTTNLEAIACGTPVITFNTGGSIESVDSCCGTIVEKKNVKDLYSAIQLYKNDRPTKENIIAKSRRYDKNERYVEYLDYYYSILTGGRSE